MSFKAGFIGLVGLPNAGKSSLVNGLVGEKVTIVTPKPQTTRQRVVGIYTDEQAQILFVDAPGVISAGQGLNHFLQEEYKSVIEESDALVAVLNLDADDPKKLERIVSLVAESGKPWIAVISKADLPLDHRRLILREKVSEYKVPVLTVSIEKQVKETKQQLLPELIGLLPESPGPLYDPEIYTTQNLREMASEMIREKCFEFLHQEIPYGLAVRIQKFSEDEGPVVKIHAEIIVNKEGHRVMVIGRGGEAIKRIGLLARKDIEKVMGRQVYLDLHVKVKKNWAKHNNVMKELGYAITSQP